MPNASLWGDDPGYAAPPPPAAFESPPAPPPEPEPPRLPVASPFMEAAPPSPPVTPPQSVQPQSAHAPQAEFARIFARAAGIPEEVLGGLDPARLAEVSGEIVRSTVVEMMQLLSARNEARRLARNPNQTVVSAADNNPLKFAPTPEDAMRILFGPPTRSYLDARRAIAQGFSDIKSHHVLTYSAMQAAVRRLAAELDPAEIEKALPAAAGIGERLGSQKARLWDFYTTRWEAKTEHHDDGLVDVFMLYFGDCYAKATQGGS
jgi:type VI secretion system protein ImpI